MAKLFFELYLDEDVNVLVAELIKAHRFEAWTAQQAGMLEQDDANQLDYGVRQGKTLLTHNRRDFQTLHQRYMEAGQHHAGIIIAVQHHPYEITRRLLRLLNEVTADEIRDQILYI